MVRAVLQGKPFGHPLHPALVHLPIGLFVFSVLLDVASYLVADGNPFVRGAFYAMLFGVVAALVAAVPGLVDRAAIRADHPAKKTATTHMWLNIAMAVIFAIDLLLRANRLGESATPPLLFLLSLLGVAILAVSGYLGGTLVYDDGIAVGRHRRQSDTPQETILARAAVVDGFVPVADAGSLGEGETLRVDVDGTVMTIARVGGKWFAFQEFCTHRFGPLSEGRLVDGEVECPWHRSRFDMRTGKVTQGPAKVDLKTYEVAVRDGTIMVRDGSGVGSRKSEAGQQPTAKS
jgi:uncharacterized membrane protein/nitrite reductase/ring-hydroxylating ferredoxin subunit